MQSFHILINLLVRISKFFFFIILVCFWVCSVETSSCCFAPWSFFTSVVIASVGKSTLLTMLTGTHSEAASYEFTTLTCIPGIIHYNDTKIQLLDLPGIIEGASEGKGRGRQVRAIICI